MGVEERLVQEEKRMLWRIAIGLGLVFTGVGDIIKGTIFGFYRFLGYPAPGLLDAMYLCAFGVMALLLSRRAVRSQPDYDLGPQICLMALLGILTGTATICCDILLLQYGAICGLVKYILSLIITFWIAMLVYRFESNDSGTIKTQK